MLDGLQNEAANTSMQVNNLVTAMHIFARISYSDNFFILPNRVGLRHDESIHLFPIGFSNTGNHQSHGDVRLETTDNRNASRQAIGLHNLLNENAI